MNMALKEIDDKKEGKARVTRKMKGTEGRKQGTGKE